MRFDSTSYPWDQPSIVASIKVEEEIIAVLIELNGDKALGPDGFTVASNLDMIKEEILGMLKDFTKKVDLCIA